MWQMFLSLFSEEDVLMSLCLCCRKTIPVNITDEDSYEKDVLFYAQLGEIRMLDGESSWHAFPGTITIYPYGLYLEYQKNMIHSPWFRKPRFRP
jgi:hypothetical protein